MVAGLQVPEQIGVILARFQPPGNLLHKSRPILRGDRACTQDQKDED
jgi:hypothetical protein